MCGRYIQTGQSHELSAIFDIDPEALAEVVPRYNVAPTDQMPVVRLELDEEQERRSLRLIRWGLVPWFSKSLKIKPHINARAETVATKGMFKRAFADRRCIVPATGFYEWRTEGKRKRPFLIRPKGGGLFGFAGLWGKWKPPEGETLHSFTIITTASEGAVGDLHDRFPVILPPEAYAAWLDPRVHGETLREHLKAPAPDALEIFEVSDRVNSVRNDDPELVEPLIPPDQLDLI